MNKKHFIAYLLAALVVCVVIYVYRSNSNPTAIDSAEVTLANPEEQMQPSEPAGDDSAAANAKNEELIKMYTTKIDTGSETDGDSYYKRGLVYQAMGQYRLAIQDFTRALHIEPKAHNALYARALAYQQERMLDEAVTDLTTAIQLNPNFVAAYNMRGIIYADQNKPNDAMNDYKMVISIDPTFYQAYFNQGILYQQMKQYADAKTAFDQAIASNKPAANATEQEITESKDNLLKAYMHRATVELVTDNLNAALDDVNYVISNDPKNTDAYKLRSEIYAKQGNTADSAADKATADSLSMENLLNNKQ